MTRLAMSNEVRRVVNAHFTAYGVAVVRIRRHRVRDASAHATEQSRW